MICFAFKIVDDQAPTRVDFQLVDDQAPTCVALQYVVDHAPHILCSTYNKKWKGAMLPLYPMDLSKVTWTLELRCTSSFFPPTSFPPQILVM
jgi:hypothetical protein